MNVLIIMVRDHEMMIKIIESYSIKKNRYYFSSSYILINVIFMIYDQKLLLDRDEFESNHIEDIIAFVKIRCIITKTKITSRKKNISNRNIVDYFAVNDISWTNRIEDSRWIEIFLYETIIFQIIKKKLFIC